MLRAALTHGDVSRETKAWREERDALARAVAGARKELRRRRVLKAIDRAFARWNKLS